MGIARNSLGYMLALSLAACGGGGSSSGGNTGNLGGSPSPSPSPSPTSSTCSLSARQDFVSAQLDEWYLFPTLLDRSVSKSAYNDLQNYIDALVAPARAQRRDRYFTYVTSIAESEAFRNQGANAGFGVLLTYDSVNNRVFVLDSYEGAPALGANIDRGTELLAIGTSANNLQLVSTLMANGGAQSVVNALGPSNPGVTRVLRVRDAAGVTREVSVAKAEYTLDPISNRFGVKIIQDGGKKVGYIHLRTHITPAIDDLRAAFADFAAQGVTELIVDQRYNGGGDPRVTEVFGDLMGKNLVGKEFSYTAFRESKSDNDSIALFRSAANAVGVTKVAFIGRGGTASASELLINAFIPYLGTNMALVGTNTYGKPVGQIGLDNASCDDRLWALAFRIQNANRQGDYYDGLASFVPNTCLAGDDLTVQLGDPRETSIRASLDFLAGRSCTPISGAKGTASAARNQLLQPDRPTAAQLDLPGLF